MRPTQAALMLGLTIASLCAGTAQPADPPSGARVGIPMKVQRYAQYLIATRDADDDGQLSQQEWEQMDGAPKLADRDRDTVITAAELADHIARYGRRRKILLMPSPDDESAGFPSLLRPGEKTPKDKTNQLASEQNGQGPASPGRGADATSDTKDKSLRRRFTVPTSRMPTGLPSWFRSLDRNGDAQLTLAEFSPVGEPADVKEFAQYDLNQDGLLTADEYVRSTTRAPASRSSDKTQVLTDEGDEFVDEPDSAELDAMDGVEATDEDTVDEEKAVPTAAERKAMSAKEKAELKKSLKLTPRPSKNRSLKR